MFKFVNLNDDDDLVLNFHSDDTKEFNALRLAVKNLDGAEYVHHKRHWLAYDTDKNIDWLFKDAGWDFIGNAYTELLRPKKIITYATPNEDIDLSKFNLSPDLREFQPLAVVGMKAREDVTLVSYPPGSGKSAIAASWLKTLDLQKPALIVCPAFLKKHWIRELERWMGDSAVPMFGQTPPAKLPDRHIVINYDILPWWISKLKNYFDAVIGDEIHFLANEEAKRTNAFDIIQRTAKYIAFLSGTPIRSRLGSLWPIVNMMAPKIFDNKKWFLHRYAGPKMEWGGRLTFDGASNVDELRNRLQSFMIRKTKAELMPWLPPKTRNLVHVPTPKSLAARSKEIRDARKDGRLSDAVELQSLQDLSHTAYFDKRKAIFDFVDSMRDEGVEKIILVAYHKKVIDDLHKKYPELEVITGGTNPNIRQEIVDRFQENPEHPGLILQVDAAGTGLTMDACHDMVICEGVWTPLQLEQIEDRIHRMNTDVDANINYYYMVAEGTVEEDMLEIVDEKAIISSHVLDGIPQKFFENVQHIYLNKAA